MKPHASPFLQRARYRLAFLTVRPRRWFFWKCIVRGSFYGSCGIQWLPKRMDWADEIDEAEGREPSLFRNVEWPNLHWVIAYLVVFNFFHWLETDAWRPLCRWGKHSRETFPWYARLVKWIGETTAGQAIHASECWHCAAADCDQCSLSDDDTGETFILERTWQCSTMDGTDHRFRGITICPKCGYRDSYEDGSL